MPLASFTRYMRLLSVALVIALAFVAGAVVSAISAPPSTTFYGCVARAGGSLYAVGTSPGSCRYGDTEISWNQQGPQGPQGAQGLPGEQGLQGEQGESGLIWMGAFDAQTVYAQYDAVHYQGSAYIALIDNPTGTPDTSADWDLLAQQGESGTSGTNPGAQACSAWEVMTGIDADGTIICERPHVEWSVRYCPDTPVAAYADFSSCDLKDASLMGGDLPYSDFSWADLTGANLQFADFNYANLEFADLSNANLHITNFSYANLRGAILTHSPSQLMYPVWNSTICPDGTNSDANGGTCINNLTPVPAP